MAYYHCGYYAGWTSPTGYEGTLQKRVKRKPFAYNKAVHCWENITFSTKEKAIKALKKLDLKEGYKFWIRPVRYQTNDHEYAAKKGYPVWPKEWENKYENELQEYIENN